MQTVLFVLVILFSAFLALWPAAFVVAAVLHSAARRWRGLGRIALLVPVWCIAASIGLIQLPRLLKTFDVSGQPTPSNPSLGTIVAVVLALCCAGIAWALLVRSFEKSATALP